MTTRLPAFTAALMLCGCVTTPPPPDATLSLANKSCSETYSTEDASPLLDFEENPSLREKDRDERLIDFDVLSPCFGSGEAAANFVVFTLPDPATHLQIRVGGLREANRTLALDIVLLDTLGTPVRSMPRDKFMLRGNALGTSLRPGPDERYLLLRSDPAWVGQAEQTTETYVRKVQHYDRGNSFVQALGSEQMFTRVYSHDGTARITVSALRGNFANPDAHD